MFAVCLLYAGTMVTAVHKSPYFVFLHSAEIGCFDPFSDVKPRLTTLSNIVSVTHQVIRKALMPHGLSQMRVLHQTQTLYLLEASNHIDVGSQGTGPILECPIW